MRKSIYQLSAFLFAAALLFSAVGMVNAVSATPAEVEKTCKDIDGFSNNLEGNSSGVWGSIQFKADSGPLVLNVNEDYEVTLCVKKGSSVGQSDYPGPLVLDPFIGPIQNLNVYYPKTSGNTGFSHYAYYYEYTPEVPGTYFQFAKVWEGDEIDLEGVSVVFIFGDEDYEWEIGDKPVMVKPGQVIEPLSEQVTGLPENCTYKSNMPPSYTIPGGYTDEASRTSEVSMLYTLEVTNTVTCEDEEEETPPAVLAAVTPPQVVVTPVGAVDAGGAGTTALFGLVGSTLAVGLGAVIRKFSL